MGTLYDTAKQLDKAAEMVLHQPRASWLGLICYFLECIDSKLNQDDDALVATETLDNLVGNVQNRLEVGRW